MRYFTPGPVELHPRVLQALSKQIVSHRSGEFREALGETLELLRKVYMTTKGDVALITGSGTAAVDAMVYSMVSPGDKVLVLVFGEFGERMLNALNARGCEVDVLHEKPGRVVDVEKVKEKLDEKEYKALFTVHTETSTGATLRWLRNIAVEAKKRNVLVCVDTVSSLAGEPLRMDEWGLDAVASCSHKCIGGPPGISFVALSPEAVETIARTAPKPSYLDLNKCVKFHRERTETPFTPAVNVIYGLLEALRILVLEEGVEARWERLRKLSENLYTKAREVGLGMLPEESVRSSSVVALTLPKDIKASSLVKVLRERYDVMLARGMGELKERVIRIGVMGYINDNDVKLIAEALQKAVGRQEGGE